MRMIILLLFGTMESDSRLVAEPTDFPSSEIENHLSRTFLTVPRDYTEQDSSLPSDSTLFSPLFAPFHPQRYEAKKQEQSKVSSNHCLSSCLTSFSVYQNRCSNAFFDCMSDVGEACGQSEFLALCKMDRASCVTSGLNELQSCQASCEQSNTSCGCLTECQLDMEKSLHFVNIQHDSCVINCDNDAACLQTCHNQLASGEESVASMFEECYLFCCVPDAGECDRTCDTATAVCLDHCLEDYKYCKLEFSADKPQRSSFDRSRESGQEIRFTSSSFQASFDSQRSCTRAEPRTPQTILRSSFCEEMKTKCDDMRVTVCVHSNPEFDSKTAISLNSVAFHQHTSYQNDHKPTALLLNAANYHGSNTLITNQHSSLVGEGTNIVHSDELKCSEQNDTPDFTRSARTDSEIDISPIILITNSTFSVSNVNFYATEPNHSVATILESRLTVDECVLHSSGTNSPIIATLSSSGGSEVNIMNTQHVSASSGTLLPFVQLAKSTESEIGHSAELTVTGANMDICESDLCLGTGLLVDFGELGSLADVSALVSTTLTNTAIVNTTSSSAPHAFAALPTISQSVIGSSIAHSTNHFAGTATLNVNHAQHFIALNSTVLSCHTALQSNEDYSNMNYTTRPAISDEYASFTRCLFKNCYTNSSNGGALNIISRGSLSVTECSFAGCYCSSRSNGQGGAICFSEFHSSYSGPTTTITKTSVANCRAHWGSAVCLNNNLKITISELVVENCSKFEEPLSSKKTGLGALHVLNTETSASLSNSVFSHCHNDHAGGVFVSSSKATHRFESLAFRGSSVEKGDNSRDFATTLASSSDFASMFSNCDSTSFGDEKPLVAVGTTDSDGNLDITHSLTDLIAGVATQQKLSIVSLSLTEDSTDSGLAICSVTVNETVTGTMFLLLDNSLLRNGSKGAPTLQRLVCVAFDEEGGSTASTSVTYGPTGMLQSSLSDYVMMTASMKGWRLSPSVSIATCALSSTGNDIDVSVHGTNFEDGSYEVELKKVSDDSTKTLTFARKFGQLFCSAVAYPESSAELEYNTEYSLESVTWNGQTLDRIIETSVFTTPVAPARLSGIGEVVFAEGKNEVILPFVSSGLSPSTKYKMVVDSVPKGSESSHNRTLTLTTDDDGSLASSIQTVYPQTSSLLSFGTEYKVRTFALSSGTSFIALDSIVFSIPDEPSRLTLVTISYELNETVAVLTLSGRLLSPQDHTLFLTNSADETDTPKIPIAYSSTESGSWSAKLSLVNAPLLKYGQTYTVTGLKMGGESGEDVFVDGPLKVTVTTEPAVINNLSFEFDADTQFSGKLVFSTVRMPVSPKLIVTVEGESTFNLTGFLTFSTPETGSISLNLFSPSTPVQLEYGKTYTISKIIISFWEKEVFFTGERDFTIPDVDPRVVSIRTSEWLDDGRGMTYTFYSVGLVNDAYEMELTDTTAGSESDPVSKLTLSVGVDGGRQFVQGTASFYPEGTATLKYSHSYKVTKITRVSSPTDEILVDTITLSVAAQQPSITAVSCEMLAGSIEKTLSITYDKMGTFGFLASYYPVFESDGVSVALSSISFSGTKATQSVQIFDNSTNPKIEYGKTYTLVRFKPYHIDTPLLLTKTFKIEVPAEKPRVTSVDQTDYTDGYSITLVFSTRLLEDGQSYDFVVSSSSHSAVLTATVSGSGDSQVATVAVSLNDDGTGELFNNATYKLNSVTKTASKETEILVEAITFKTPIIAPTISDVSVRMDTVNGERNVIIRLDGNNFSTPPYTSVFIGDTALVSYFAANSTTWFEFYIRIFNDSYSKLSYGKQYTITRVSNGVDCVILKPLSFVVPAEKPRLAHATVTSVSGHHSCTITFATRLLENGATYNILMTGTPTTGSGAEHTGYVTATVSSSPTSQEAIATARLSEDGKNADLINGYTYVPKEVVKTSGKTEANIIIDNFVVKTDPGVPKVTSVKAYFTPNFFEQNLTIEFGGSELRGLPNQRVTVNDGTKDIELNWHLTFSSDTEGTMTAELAGARAELEYGKTYSVVKIVRSFYGESPLVKEGLEFTVPEENPRLISLSSQTNATDVKSTTFAFNTRKLEDGETYEITFSGTSSAGSHMTILRVVALTTNKTQTATGTAILSPPEEASMWHGMTYTPISMKKVNSENEESSIVIHKMTVTTPADNRKVTSCGVDFTDLSEKTLKITLGGTNLPTDSTFIVTIDAATPFDLKARGKFSSADEGSIVATTFKRGQAPELEYGQTYTLKSMRYEANGAPVVLSSNLKIDVPEATGQILDATGQFDVSSSTAIVTLYGNNLKNAEMTVEVSDSNDNRVTSTTKTIYNENTKSLSVRFAASEKSEPNCLIIGQSYTVKVVGGGDEESMPVFDGVTFKLKHKPTIKHVEFEFTNKMGTKAQLRLSGTDFPDNEVLTGTLTGGMTFAVTCGNDDTAVSEPIVIGFANTLEYATEYSFVSLTLPGDDFNMFDVSSSHFVTDARPTQSEFVVSEGDEDGKGCGEESKPCGSIGKVIELSIELGMKNIVVDLKGDIKQATTLTIPVRSSITLQNFSSNWSTLVVPRTASQGEKKGLVSVYEASLTLLWIKLEVSGSTSVSCVVFGMGSTFIIEHCSVFVEKTDVSDDTITNEVVCSWKTGLFMLEKSTINLISSSFEKISQGVLDMSGGSLTVQHSQFNGNGKKFDDFPSMRQNVECRNEGTIDITTTQATDEALWIAADNCKVVKDSIETKAPMFVPTFDVNKTAVEFDKANDKFVVKMKGTLLIPCGLKLDVYEVFPKNKTETGKHKLIELTGENTADWTETELVATILHSELKPDLDVKKDWLMALSFGQDERSSSSLKFQEHTKGASAAAIVVPIVIVVVVCVVVGCIVAFVCIRRRKRQQNQYKPLLDSPSGDRTSSKNKLTEGEDVVRYGAGGENKFSRGSINTTDQDVDEGTD
ncbi:hypothetical protein BLNAU_18211 [Blattamonas nauphoetae]|uniref:Uncharacterized protein n=1 Tax=Blattamonas nauphoetae TaxID=2049346 RepID=A0ABQ9X4Y8_9EUKA|nr:hypothetical protein BLNAU_18211 [Blattamonas nauphoetae]